ncbi:phosphoglycolate phosphatase, partial [Pseudomonas syringae pv. tagetis]
MMFDLDGPLVDSVTDLALSVDPMLCELGRPIAGLESVRAWVGIGAPVLVRRALANNLVHSGVDDALAEQGVEIFMRAYA